MLDDEKSKKKKEFIPWGAIGRWLETGAETLGSRNSITGFSLFLDFRLEVSLAALARWSFLAPPGSWVLSLALTSVSSDSKASSAHPQEYLSEISLQSKTSFPKRALTWLWTKQPHCEAASRDEVWGGYFRSKSWKWDAHWPL